MSGLYPAGRPKTTDKAQHTEDPYAFHMEMDTQVREYVIAVEQVKIMQQKLKECYLRSGVNHHEDCKDLRESLWARLNTPNYGAPGPPRSVRGETPPDRVPTCPDSQRAPNMSLRDALAFCPSAVCQVWCQSTGGGGVKQRMTRSSALREQVGRAQYFPCRAPSLFLCRVTDSGGAHNGGKILLVTHGRS